MARKSKRSAQFRAEQTKKARTRRIQIGGLILAAAAILSGLVWWANRPQVVEGNLSALADRTAWGPADAPVIIEEWSDFA